ncbi:MAG: sugar ABC transporter ATP-binding protein [Candidatus Dormiibacterota bacterium]
MFEARGISKSYGGVVALREADLVVKAGSAHALLGENGAGKSTLVKIIAGAVRPDAGVLRLNDSDVAFANTADAARHGVAMVSQELNLFPDLDVLANLYPMREPLRGPLVDRATMAKQAEPVLAELGLQVSLRERLGNLDLAQRQLVEIAKALVSNPSVLILDEPTSALQTDSTEALMSALAALRERNVAVVFVSHILEEAMRLCDEFTVLRDGQVALAGARREEIDVSTLVAAMLGDRYQRTLSQPAAAAASEVSTSAEPNPEAPGHSDPGLRLEGISLAGALEDVSFKVAPGEIVGLAGLAGSGPLGVLEVVSGSRVAKRGQVWLPGGKPLPRGLRSCISSGVALVSGDRRRVGLMLDKPLWENMAQVRSFALARDGFLVGGRSLRRRARRWMEELGIRASSPNQMAAMLSGGNQQKLVFAKWLESEPTVLLLDDPTRGVDVGAKAEMHNLFRRLLERQAVVILCSTDLDELATVCDRVLVFYRHRICAELDGASLNQSKILEVMNTGSLEKAA